MKKLTGTITIFPLGGVKHRRKTFMVGVSHLRGHGVRGIALTPKELETKTGAIVISSHLPPGKAMFTEALIHETLHIAFPKATEKQVEQGAHLVAKVLRVANGAIRRKRRSS